MATKTVKKTRSTGIYSHNILVRTVWLPFNVLGSNIRENIEQILREKMEGKCMKEGYIKPNSCKIVNYSSGILREDKIIFDVVINCHICLPTEGMVIYCNVKNITKAGIKAEIDESPSPLIIFIS